MIRIGICGWGNLGRGAAAAVAQSGDMRLAAIFSRRADTLTDVPPDAAVFRTADAAAHAGEIDVLLLCGGSAADLPVQTPELARHFHVADTFDTHASMEEHFRQTDAAARAAGHLALIGAGWDPGLFSLVRTAMHAILPDAVCRTLWGRGVSQGHSDAVRRIPGVADARAYTLPRPGALAAARRGEGGVTPASLHRRECLVVPEDGADTEAIAQAIRSMPHYFQGYETEIRFVAPHMFPRGDGALPHAGHVVAAGKNGTAEFSLSLPSNPAFTGAVLAACARAVFRLAQAGERGCRTAADIPLALLSPLPPEKLRQTLL